MRIEVIREAPDGLSRERWLFYFYDHAHLLAVDIYSRENRLSCRHKFRASAQYERLDGNRYFSVPRIEKDDVPLPIDVAKEAREKFADALAVGMWQR